MGIMWMEHQGKKILYADFRGAKEEGEMMSLLKQLGTILNQQNTKVLLLCNLENTFMTDALMSESKSIGKMYDGKVLKFALVGITGVKKILLNTWIMFTGMKDAKPFDTEDLAKNWLAS